jgi:hypothetical protein
MLSFTDSLQKEMLASTLLGRELDFMGVRAAFANNEPIEAMRLLNKELEGINWEDLDPFEKAALADSINQSEEQLAGILNKTEESKEITKSFGDVFKKLLPEDVMTNLQRMRNAFLKISEIMVGSIGPAFEGFIGFIAPIVEGLAWIIEKVEEFIGWGALLKGTMVGLGIAFTVMGGKALIAAGKSMVAAVSAIMEGVTMGSLLTAVMSGGASTLVAVAIGAGLVTAAVASYNRAKSAVTEGSDIELPGRGRAGPTVRTTEGGLFRGSANDDVLMGPGLAGVSTGGGQGMAGFNLVASTTKNLGNPIGAVREEIHQLRREMMQYFGAGGTLARSVGKETASRTREAEHGNTLA